MGGRRRGSIDIRNDPQKPGCVAGRAHAVQEPPCFWWDSACPAFSCPRRPDALPGPRCRACLEQVLGCLLLGIPLPHDVAEPGGSGRICKLTPCPYILRDSWGDPWCQGTPASSAPAPGEQWRRCGVPFAQPRGWQGVPCLMPLGNSHGGRCLLRPGHAMGGASVRAAWPGQEAAQVARDHGAVPKWVTPSPTAQRERCGFLIFFTLAFPPPPPDRFTEAPRPIRPNCKLRARDSRSAHPAPPQPPASSPPPGR